MTAGNSLRREGVRLAPEVDLDDLELGERECQGDDRPRDA